MQKKSLLVALFCGALCLTGCLKNEESASVAQVRIAKANELNSIADLNKAKAQAEVIYANAEATLKQAEAELKQAEAALKNAEAETEKVNAELLKVKVEIEKVKVEEEKVKLQMMQADLESRLAALEVEKAAAEAAIQGWVNVLEDLVAKAEINAVKNSQDLIKAEYDLEAYILKQEGMKADSARIYAALYFEALDSVAVLQAKELAVKAAKVLVNRGALDVREFIYDQIEENNKQIDENNAKIEALKKYQTMDTTAAKAALLEARIAMTEAFNEYKDYVDAQEAAEDAYEALDEKVSLFEGGSKPQGEGDWNHSFVNFITSKAKTGDIQTKDIQDFEDFGKVTYSGYYVGKGTDKTFVPLWKAEQKKYRWALYPSAEEQSVRSSFFQTEEMVIAPAEIFYDNIEGYLDTIVNSKNREIAKKVADREALGTSNIEKWQNQIQTNEDSLTLMKAYVEARQAVIDQYESEIATLVAQYNEGVDGLSSAKKAYQEYMVVNYDIRRGFFEELFKAEADTVAEHDTLVAAQLAYDLVEALVPGLEAAYDSALDDEAEAEGAYNTAKTVYDATHATLNQNLETAIADWNPKFDYKAVADTTGKWVDVVSDNPDKFGYYELKDGAVAGKTQKEWLKAKAREDLAYINWQKARREAAAHPNDADLQAEERQKYADYVIAGANVEVKAIYMNAAKDIYTAAKKAVDTASAPVTEAAKEWNPDFDKNQRDANLVKDEQSGKEYWVKSPAYNQEHEADTAGTSQAAMLYADKALKEAEHQVDDLGYDGPNYTKPTLKQAVKDASDDLNDAKEKYARDFALLLEALGIEDEEEYVEDPKVKELYTAMKEAEGFKKEWEDKLATLSLLYGTSTVPRGNEGFKNEYIYIAPDEPFTTGQPWNPETWFNQRLGISWMLCNYHMDPEYQYIANVVEDEDNPGKYVIEKEYAAIPLGYWDWDEDDEEVQVPDFTKSISYQNIDLNKSIKAEPGNVANDIKGYKDEIKPINEGVAKVKTAIKELQGYEADYKAWVEQRQEAYEAVNAAKKDVFDSYNEYVEAKAEFQAAEAVVNEGVWIYDPEFNYPGKTSPWDQNGYERTGNGEHFVKIPIAKEIQKLEKENENLEKQNAKYRQDLSDGKVCLQYVNEILDEILDQIEEAIQIWAAIAEQYKAIMNGYLGIVDEADVEGETGPLDGEGDDEE